MKKKLDELRAKKTRLEADARAKLDLIKNDTPADIRARTESEHAALLDQIVTVTREIADAEARGDGYDDSEEGERKRKLEKERKEKEEKDEKERKDKEAKERAEKDEKERAAAGTYTSAATVEMATIDVQARSLGIDLNLPEALGRGEKPDGMRKRLFEELAKRSGSKGPRSSTGPELLIVRDEGEGIAAAMEVALVTRILASQGHSGIKYEPKREDEKLWVERHRAQAQQYVGMGFVEIAAECIGYRGNIRSAGKALDILTRAFSSTSDFPNIFQNVLNKSLLARYELAVPTYREIAVERPFNDFRPHPQIRAGDFPTLQPVSETGEIKYGKSSDTGENVSVFPYGVVFSISRQMIVNDELGAIDQLLGSAGDVVMVFENTNFFTMFNSNPVLNQDGFAVFETAHHNTLAGAGAVPSVTTIGSGRQALRGMKSINGLFLNVPPRIILTGPVQETVADQMVTAITPTLTTSVNPFSGRLRSVSDANITDSSWYLLTEPRRVTVFIYGFLNGANGPRVRTFEPFGVQGVKVSLEHDFGCGAIDFRGAWKNPGA